MTQAGAVNDNSVFLDMMADVILQTWNRYRSGTPLPLGSALAPARAEGPPPFR